MSMQIEGKSRAFDILQGDKKPWRIGQIAGSVLDLTLRTKYMKRVFSSSDSAEVGLLKDILLKEGVNCVEMDEPMAQTVLWHH